MKYAHIIAAATEECWAMREEKLLAMFEFLALQSQGIKFSAEEMAARIAPQTAAAVARKEGAVAIIPLRGVIANRASLLDDISGGMSNESFGRAFQGALKDDAIKAIVLDVDSPGGMVSGSDENSSMIFAARGSKSIVAQVNATAASAAYWIASAADEIVVTPSGSVGSIGVVGMRDDVSKAMDIAGVKKSIISAGRFKADGYPFDPMGEEERARIQAQVDSAYGMFVDAVARNRNVAASVVRDGFGQGGMVGAKAAVSQGMADRVGTMEETLNRFGASLYAPAPRAQQRASTAARTMRAALL